VETKWKITGTILHNRRKCYTVECSCGYKGVRRIDHVESGRSTCCKKCSAKETVKTNSNGYFCKRPHEGIGDLTKTVWAGIREGAKKRDISFDLTIEQAWEQFVRQNGTCALSGVPINLSSKLLNSNPDYSDFTASLDRKDSSKGYTVDNIQWVHKVINRMKGPLSDEEFKTWCKLVEYTKLSQM